jgi:hypothetical protein
MVWWRSVRALAPAIPLIKAGRIFMFSFLVYFFGQAAERLFFFRRLS